MQHVLVIHGAGAPRLRQRKVYWKPMLEADLGANVDVRAPRMPAPDDPHYQPWADRIASLAAGMKRPVLVGHSFGASTILKLLAQPDIDLDPLGTFLIATPFWGRNFPEFALTARERRRLQAVAPLTFYHSDDDDTVAFSQFTKLRRALPHARFRALRGRGHEFNQARFPELAADIRRLLRQKAN